MGAVLCAAALAGTLVLHGAINHGNKAAPKETVTTVNSVGHPVDGSIGSEEGTSEDRRITRPPDSPSPRVSSPDDPNSSADRAIVIHAEPSSAGNPTGKFLVNNSGGD